MPQAMDWPAERIRPIRLADHYDDELNYRGRNGSLRQSAWNRLVKLKEAGRVEVRLVLTQERRGETRLLSGRGEGPSR